MKKYLLLTILGALFFSSKAQKITEYKASNGITYHLKDTITLGRGSGVDGWFVYMVPSSLNTSDTQRDWFKRKFTNTGVTLKKIEVSEIRGIKRYKFIVGGGALYNFHLNIEEAIATCEVTPCLITTKTENTPDKLDQIKKLKDLLDAGALTQAEYDEQKKRILN